MARVEGALGECEKAPKYITGALKFLEEGILLFRICAGEKENSLCKKYWEYCEESGFLYDLRQLADLFGKNPEALERDVKESCLAYYDMYVCDYCGDPLKYFQLREEFIQEKEKIDEQLQKRKEGTLLLCRECLERAPLNLSFLGREDIVDAETVKNMENAFFYGIYETLSDLEFYFLANLAVSNDFYEGAIKTGISAENARNLLTKLTEKDLLCFSYEKLGYYILPALTEALGNIHYINSLFGSRKSRELYRVLKEKYQYVFPEVLLSTFIDFDMIEWVLKERWERMYFYFARVDFLICDSLGIPEKVVEYDGGYHGSSKSQERKDELKEKIINAAGLAVERYTESDLRHKNCSG